MRSRGRRKSWSALLAISKFFLWFCLFFSEWMFVLCTHNILPRKRVGRNTYILQCSLSTLGCALLRVPPMRPSASLPFVWLGGKREKWGGCGCVCALIVVKGGCPYTPFFSLSLSPTQYTYRHTEHTVSDLQCMSKVCCAFYFPLFSVYTEEAKLKCGSSHRRASFFFCQASSSYDAHNPKKEKNNNWELVKFLIWCLYV